MASSTVQPGSPGGPTYERDLRRDRARLAEPDVDEVDLTLDYRPKSGILEGLWVRLRGAWADFDDGASAWNARLIVNYSMPLL